jgi:hypothetical protein
MWAGTLPMPDRSASRDHLQADAPRDRTLARSRAGATARTNDYTALSIAYKINGVSPIAPPHPIMDAYDHHGCII